MMNTNLNAVSIFSPAQLAGMIAIAVVVALLIIGNLLLYYFLRRHRVRKLCTSRLQAKRNELLEHLRNITDDGSVVSGGMIYSDIDLSEVEEAEEDVDVDEDEDEDEDEDAEGEPAAMTETADGDDEITQNDILAVADMSEYTRKKLGFEGDEYNNKRYFVRYKYGFEARLRASADDVKERYAELVKELSQYKGIQITTSFKGQRIYKGRKTLGQFFLRGKTLCVAFALDPNEFAQTKYRGIDKSDKKRFEKTPMMYKLTSMRRVDYARYLIIRLAEINMILPDPEAATEPVDLSPRTPDELFVAQGLRITVLGEAPELEYEEEPEISIEETGDLAASDEEENADDEQAEPDELSIDTPEGKIVFDRSFTARLIQSDEAFKARYSDIKNYILSYKGVRCRTSWKRETFSLGRKVIATIAIRGKTLMLYLACDPSQFDGTKYKVENMSEVASRRKTPLLFRVKSDRRATYAKQLIDMVFSENGAAHVERKHQDYALPFKATEELVEHGLIKLITKQNFGIADNKTQ